MNVVFRIAVVIMAIFAGAVVVALFVAPGLRDGDEHIAEGYYFSHGSALGIQMSITKGRQGGFTEVIGMKVEEFIVHDNAIFVTQRPVVSTGKLDQLTDTCLYYRIDIANHKVYGPFTFTDVKTQAEWNFLKQRRPPVRIPRKLDTCSAANWTVIPAQTGQSFQRKLDTCSMPNWTPVPRQTGHLGRKTARG